MTPVRKLFAPELARRCAETLLPFALLSARDDEVAEGRALAARLIGEPIVATDDFRRVHRRSGMGLFLAREEGRLTGILAFVPLTSEGVEALLADRFDGRAPIDAHVAEIRGLFQQTLDGWSRAGGRG